MDWVAIGAVITVLVAASALVLNALGILEKLASLVGRAWRALIGRGTTASSAHPPSRTLIVIQRPQPNALWWHMGHSGSQAREPLMQICADLNVTNIWQNSVAMASAVVRFRRWGLFARTELADAHVFNGGQTIPAGAMAWVRVHVMFKRPWTKMGKAFTADVAIVDQFGNQHWLSGLRFPYH